MWRLYLHNAFIITVSSTNENVDNFLAKTQSTQETYLTIFLFSRSN